MSDHEQPLATTSMEDVARGMMEEGLSADEYAARWGHGLGCFSLDDYRYRDPGLHAWIHALGDILFKRPGAPTIDELRRRFLSIEEQEAIAKQSGEDF